MDCRLHASPFSGGEALSLFSSGAARELRRAQSAISHAISALESAFDCVLFERNALQTAIKNYENLAEAGGAVRSSGGVSVQTEALGEPRYDTVLVVGGASRLPVGPAMIDFLRQL